MKDHKIEQNDIIFGYNIKKRLGRINRKHLDIVIAGLLGLDSDDIYEEVDKNDNNSETQK
jgi:hypothetical protein